VNRFEELAPLNGTVLTVAGFPTEHLTGHERRRGADIALGVYQPKWVVSTVELSVYLPAVSERVVLLFD